MRWSGSAVFAPPQAEGCEGGKERQSAGRRQEGTGAVDAASVTGVRGPCGTWVICPGGPLLDPGGPPAPTGPVGPVLGPPLGPPVGPPTGPPVGEVVGAAVVDDVVGGGCVTAQMGKVIVSVSRVTAPLRASTRPTTVTPVVTVMLCRARTLPVKVDAVPRVAELPICQYTLHGLAPLIRLTLARRGGGQGRPRSEHPYGVGVTLSVECQRPREAEAGGRVVDTLGQALATQVARDGVGRLLGGRHVVGRREVGLGLERHSIGRVDRSVHQTGRKTGHRCPGAQPEVAVDDARAGVRHRRARQYGVAAGGPQRDRDGRSLGGSHEGERQTHGEQHGQGDRGHPGRHRRRVVSGRRGGCSGGSWHRQLIRAW